MPGSIRQRRDRGPDAWELRVFVGRDSEGRSKQKSTLFRGTKRAAERELARLVVHQDDNPVVVPDDEARGWGPATTINDAIAGWKENDWDDLSPATVRRYEDTWRLYIKETIGKRKIASLNPYDVEKYFRKMKNDGVGRETVRYVRSVMHRACRLARKWSGNQLHNPITDTELPQWGLEHAPTPVRAPTVGELRALLDAAADLDPRYAVALRVVAATGVRRGEACALRWDDIDFEDGVLTIDEGVVPGNGGAVVKAPKTRASIRKLAVGEGTIDALRSLRRVQEELAADCEVELPADAFVFSADPGGELPPYPDTLSRAFLTARKAAGLPEDLHLHSLRHFQATALDSVVAERQKQARLGWATVHMARHYTDVIAVEDRRAAEHVEGLLG